MFNHPRNIGHGLICIAAFSRSSLEQVQRLVPLWLHRTEPNATGEYFATCTNVHAHTHENTYKRYCITTSLLLKVELKWMMYQHDLENYNLTK